MQVVVTGACGHIGATLVRDLIAQQHRVRVLSHPQTKTLTALAGLDVEVAHGDVRDLDSLRTAFRGAEIVYHLAAMISLDGDRHGHVRRVNVDGARNAATAALTMGVRRHVHVSSVHAFDHHPVDEPLDETRRRPGPQHPTYDRTKAAGEAAVREVIARGLDAVIVNPSGVIGPRDFAPSRMGQMLLHLARRRMPAVSHGGFDWVDVRDVSRSILAAAERGRTGENYLLTGRYRSVAEFVRIVEAVTGVRSPRLRVPRVIESLAATVFTLWSRALGTRPHFTQEAIHALHGSRNIVGARAASELGHRARPTEHTIRDTYAWFAHSGKLPELRGRFSSEISS
jgi:dihydroflavonol-4-reductase